MHICLISYVAELGDLPMIMGYGTLAALKLSIHPATNSLRTARGNQVHHSDPRNILSTRDEQILTFRGQPAGSHPMTSTCIPENWKTDDWAYT